MVDRILNSREPGNGNPPADKAIPPGWDFNPSTWPQRLPIVLLSLLGFLIAAYLTLFQTGIFDSVWGPFFGEGSRVILTSRISRILPIPDAALGVVSIMLVIFQPVLFDSWCTLCLASALISLAMIGPAMDEVLASLQHMARVARRRETSAWLAFWGLAR